MEFYATMLESPLTGAQLGDRLFSSVGAAQETAVEVANAVCRMPEDNRFKELKWTGYVATNRGTTSMWWIASPMVGVKITISRMKIG